MISAIVLAAVSGAFVAPAFAQDAPVDTPNRGAVERQMGRENGPKFDFSAFDTDGDGKITAEEFTAARTAKAAALDANNDGKISADELVARDMEQMQKRAEMRAKRMIEARDTDGDGLLSASELATRSMPKNVFDRLDADNDGTVTQEEVDAMKAKMADHRDRGGRHDKGDRDGKRGHDGDRGHDGKRDGHKGDGHKGKPKPMNDDQPDTEDDNG
jgi:Ca2+-binding EF-hand superfamily protein